MRLIDVLLQQGLVGRKADPFSTLLAIGASMLYGYLTRPRPIDMDVWRERGSFNGIDLLCMVGAQHEVA